MRSINVIPRRGMLATIEVRARQGEAIRSMACDVCGRTELVSQPGDDAFAGWSVSEGQNHSPWVVCPACSEVA